MVASKASAASVRSGVPLETSATLEDLVGKAARAPQNLVILDLSMEALDVGHVVERLRALTPPPRAIIAFGPHVHEARLAAAAEAGCDQVMSRGQFHAQMDQILTRAAGR